MQDGRERCALVTGTGGGCHKRRVISDPERAWGRLDVASPVLVRKFRIGKSGKRLPCSMDVVWAADPQRMLISPASRCVDFMSRTIDKGSARFKEKMTSKAFRATLPRLRDDQLRHLQRWSNNNCSQAAVFRDERGAVVLLALKDQPRSSSSFARTVRTFLRRAAIDVPLRGRWLQLVSAREVLTAAQQCEQQDRQAPRNAEEDGDRVICLG